MTGFSEGTGLLGIGINLIYLFFFTAEGEGKLHVQEFYSSVSPPTSAFIVKDSPSLVVGVCVYKNCYSKSSFSLSKNLAAVKWGGGGYS